MAASITLLDIETAPSVGFVWGKYDQNVIAFVRNWFILSFSWKELCSNEVHIRALPDYAEYEEDKENDLPLVRDLWRVFDTSDIIIAHNGDAFDIKKGNARFISHDLPPPSSYKTVDTLKIARKHFRFDSNKLHDLAQYLELGGKKATSGWKTWEGCIKGDHEQWELMREYNAQDVLLLEKVYLKLRPWAVSHPDLSIYGEHEDGVCPTCGSDKTQRRGYSYAKVQVRQRWNCTSCGHWYSGKIVRKNAKSPK